MDNSALSPAAEQLFALLRAALKPCGSLPDSSDCELRLEPYLLPDVFALACAQGVQAVAWDGLQELLRRAEAGRGAGIDSVLAKPLKLRWALSCEKIESKYARQRSTIAALAEFYAQHGIEMMLLKGYGLSLWYPRPEHRPCGDVDIWLYGQQKRADELLSGHKGVKIDNEHHHHTVFYYNGVMVENHYDFFNVHSHLSNREVERTLREFARQPGEKIEVEGQKVNLPPSNLNALFLLRHAAAHFAAVEIALRHLIDWALFVSNEGQKVDWAALEKIARLQNMDKFLHCLNGICAEYLFMPLEFMPPFERDRALERRVLGDILCPEFGEKEPEAAGIVALTRFRARRWWANRWKHRIVYREGLLATFLFQMRAHLMKPKSLK